MISLFRRMFRSKEPTYTRAQLDQLKINVSHLVANTTRRQILEQEATVEIAGNRRLVILGYMTGLSEILGDNMVGEGNAANLLICLKSFGILLNDVDDAEIAAECQELTESSNPMFIEGARGGALDADKLIAGQDAMTLGLMLKMADEHGLS